MKTAVLTVACIVSLSAGVAAGPWDDYELPRMPDGTPDMQGIWTNASVTALERPSHLSKLVINKAEAEAWERGALAGSKADARPTDPDAPALPVGSADGVGGYNRFWIDFGTKVAQINGEYRSSWLVEPKNGKLPWSSAGRSRSGQAVMRSYTTAANPEVRSPGERCIIGYGSSGGPPMLNVLYNNNYQIVQTPKTVAILVEMAHNTRLIRIDGAHRPKDMRGWLGDSIGRWDGDTLVVNTENFHPDASMRTGIRNNFYMSPNAKVEERFTRVSDTEIFYEFSVDDPEIYTQTWRAEMVLRKTDAPIYEYACHEANYSMFGILAGARRQEAEARGER